MCPWRLFLYPPLRCFRCYKELPFCCISSKESFTTLANWSWHALEVLPFKKKTKQKKTLCVQLHNMWTWHSQRQSITNYDRTFSCVSRLLLLEDTVLIRKSASLVNHFQSGPLDLKWSALLMRSCYSHTLLSS